jgi:sterol desaturase/sphingolipid hydroxylase (fatty acid hydroxylase superfamily)
VDLAYWFVTPIVAGGLSRLLVLGLVAGVGMLAGHGTDGPAFLATRPLAATLSGAPFALVLAGALVVADGLGYASHRLRHVWVLWRLHAVHHGTRELTSLAAARLHPLDEILDAILIDVPLLLAGVPLPVVAALGPIFVLHTLLLHANVPWGFGSLGRVLASPLFHRRHHARDLPPANYAGVFAFYDVLFGTYAAPEPSPCGIPDGEVPESVLAQLAYPFR